MPYTHEDIQDIIMNYHWMHKELNRLALLLNAVESVGVASYSDEPKNFNGGPSRRVEAEVIRRDRDHRRMKKYAERVNFIAVHSEVITDEREQAVLACLLDGMGIQAISRHMGMNRKTIYELRDSIVEKMGQDVKVVR